MNSDLRSVKENRFEDQLQVSGDFLSQTNFVFVNGAFVL